MFANKDAHPDSTSAMESAQPAHLDVPPASQQLHALAAPQASCSKTTLHASPPANLATTPKDNLNARSVMEPVSHALEPPPTTALAVQAPNTSKTTNVFRHVMMDHTNPLATLVSHAQALAPNAPQIILAQPV